MICSRCRCDKPIKEFRLVAWRKKSGEVVRSRRRDCVWCQAEECRTRREPGWQPKARPVKPPPKRRVKRPEPRAQPQPERCAPMVLPHCVTDGPALLKLVRVTLRQAFVWRDHEAFAEAVQEGALAALQAAQRLDERRGDAVAYLRQRIRGSAQDGFRRAATVTRGGARRVRFVTGRNLDAYCA